MEKPVKVRGLLQNPSVVSSTFYNQQAQDPAQFVCNNNATDTTSPPFGADDYAPFTILASIMQDVTKDGGIKKMVLYEGYGPALQDKTVISIYFEAYLEYDAEPFDSTVRKRRPYTFCLAQEAAVATLSLAVQTMKLSEESQFLIQPIYVFGTRGFLKPVPPNSAVLLKITVKNTLESPPSSPADQNQEFRDVYKYAHVLSLKAKELYDRQLYRQAVKEYSTAVFKLESVETKDQVEHEKQQRQLLHLLTNVVTLYTKLEEPRRACKNANQVYNLCKTALLKIPVKVLFNHARSLILLSDFNAAKGRLKQAQKLEPLNEAITKELENLEAKKKEIHNKKMVATKAPNAEATKLHMAEISREFKKAIADYCEELLNDESSCAYRLPDMLTEKELEFSKKEMHKYGFELKHSKRNGVDHYFILKVDNVAKGRLKQAQKLEPLNEVITKELEKLEAKRKEIHNKKIVARKAPNAEATKLHVAEISREFKKAIADYCEELLNDESSCAYRLPDMLTEKELEFSKKEMQKYGFELKHSKRNGVDHYFILKVANVFKY